MVLYLPFLVPIAIARMRYSMNVYWDSLLRLLLECAEARNIVEIGTDRGGLTTLLAGYCKERGGVLDTIDVQSSVDREEYARTFGDAVRFHTGLSLNILPTLRGYDAVIIDGDHNWFTVMSELQIIEREARATTRFPLIILHDTGWPYGRRDVYTDPETIPPAYRQPLQRKGLMPGTPGLVESGGLNRNHENALYEATPRNGVRTAVEDFLRESSFPLRHVFLPGYFGLGILAPEDSIRRKPALGALWQRLTPTPELERHIDMIETVRLWQLVEAQETEEKVWALEEASRRTRALEEELRRLRALEEESLRMRAQLQASDAKLEAAERACRALREQYADARTSDEWKALLAQHDALAQQRDTLQQSVSTLEQENDIITEKWMACSAKFAHVVGTRSWKLTAPLRMAEYLLRSFLKPKAAPTQAETPVPEQAEQAVRKRTSRTPAHKEKEAILQRIRDMVLSFDRHEHPTVSIVIPVLNQIAFTCACLESIKFQTDEVPYEIIVVDDGSTDETPAMLQAIAGLTVLRNDRNSGFTASCNKGASAARGRYVVFLNNDTIVGHRWLSNLLRTFDAFPDTGIAGPKFLAPDGSLLEAGGAVWNDGTAWNIGRGEDPDLPEYNYVRDVDYCSGACLMIPKTLFERLGGFDDHFSPAYYEDTDLAFRVRAAGLHVRYQPGAVIMHYEGATAGKDVTKGVKRYQEINHKKFVERWKETLKNQLPPETRGGMAERRRRKPALLVIDVTTPRPDMDSGSQRMFNMLHILKNCAGTITFLAAQRHPASTYTQSLQSLGIETHHDEPSVTKYLAQHAREFDVIIVSRAEVACDHMEDLRYFAPDATIVFDTVDLHHVRESRHADLTGNMQKSLDAEEWKRQELAAAELADWVLVVSDEEKRVVQAALPSVRVLVIPNIHDVSEAPEPWEHREDLLFIGGFQHAPNVDAMEWFTAEIFPHIQREIPGVHLWIVGSNPPDAIRKLAGPDISVTGFVPDALPYIQHCKVSVAPLRFGAGLKGKITQAASNGLPIVTTTIGAEGTGLRDGEDIFVADDPQVFAEKTVALYRDKRLWEQFSRNARATITDLCDPDRIKNELLKLFA